MDAVNPKIGRCTCGARPADRSLHVAGCFYFAPPPPDGTAQHPTVLAKMRQEAKELADNPISPNHYARYAIQPITFILANKLPFCVGNVIKYVCRYDAKNGREDLLKAKRNIELILEQMDKDGIP